MSAWFEMFVIVEPLDDDAIAGVIRRVVAPLVARGVFSNGRDGRYAAGARHEEITARLSGPFIGATTRAIEHPTIRIAGKL